MNIDRWGSFKNGNGLEEDGAISARSGKSTSRSSFGSLASARSMKKQGSISISMKKSKSKSKYRNQKNGSQDTKKQKNSKKQKDQNDLPKVNKNSVPSNAVPNGTQKKEKEKNESKESFKVSTSNEASAIDAYMRAITEQEKKMQEKFIQVKIVSYHDGSVMMNKLLKPNMTIEEIKFGFQLELELLPPRPDDDADFDFPTQLLPGQILRVGDVYNEGKELSTPHLTDEVELAQAWELSPFGMHQRLRRFIKKSGHRLINVGRVGAKGAFGIGSGGGGGAPGGNNASGGGGVRSSSPKLPKLPIARNPEKSGHSKQQASTENNRLRLLLYWERRTIDDDYKEALEFQAHAIAQHVIHGAPTHHPVPQPSTTASGPPKSVGRMTRLASIVEGDREHLGEDFKVPTGADITTWVQSENERKDHEQGYTLPQRKFHRKNSIFANGRQEVNATPALNHETQTLVQQAESAAAVVTLREERRTQAGERNAKKQFRETEEVRKGKLLLDIGRWEGVACVRQRFMKLHLPRCNPPLMGALSSYPGFSHLSEMSRLNLSCNQLSGHIPGKDMARLFNLSQLKLSKNLFTGCIPKQLTQLKHLSELHIAKNNLTGHVPSCLSSLNSLQVLDLSHNKLTGSLPDELGELRSLRVLDLSHNTLKGWLNKWVGMLGELQRLSLQHNRLAGRLPEAISRLTVLEYLHLNSNRFEGDITVQCFATLNPKMREIFLRNNAFYAPMRVAAENNSDDIEVDEGRWEKLLESKRNIENFFEKCVVLV